MALSLARLINVVGIDPAQALAMATSVPAGLIGQGLYGGLTGRDLSDLMVLGDDWSVTGALPDLLDVRQ